MRGSDPSEHCCELQMACLQMIHSALVLQVSFGAITSVYIASIPELAGA